MNNVIEDYQKVYAVYETYASRLESLLVDVLQTKKIRIHFSESRAKSIESFQEKISRPGKSYADPISQITDLVGVRLVLYYQDDIEKVGELVKKEFELIEVERSHQIEELQPDQFGYISIHYVVKLGKSRRKLPEWESMADITAEIQIRTVLQHSWAAISHALQYKREGDVPLILRRKLNRLAGLFELADEQFISIRDEGLVLASRSAKPGAKFEGSTKIDVLSIEKLLNTSADLKALITYMEELGFNFSTEDPDDTPGILVEDCEWLGINSIDSMIGIIAKDYKNHFSELMKKSDNENMKGWTVSKEFVVYLMLIANYPDKYSVDHLVNTGAWGSGIAERVLSTRFN